MSVAENYFAAEQLIVERLREEVPELAFVDGSRSLQEVIDRAVPTPAALVVFGGDTIQKTRSGERGAIQVVSQTWLVEIVVRNDWCIDSGAGERFEAGSLISKIIRVLAGWQPSSEFDPLTRSQGNRPVFEGGEGFYQLAFTTEVVL